jgi:UrcA family protein
MTSAQAAPASSAEEQVTVQTDGPYTVQRQVIPPATSRMSEMEIHKTSVSRGVTYSDLDLSKDSDVAILKDRAREAASDVCRQADRRGEAEAPASRPLMSSPSCVNTARQQAMANVNRIVADARAGRTVAAN